MTAKEIRIKMEQILINNPMEAIEFLEHCAQFSEDIGEGSYFEYFDYCDYNEIVNLIFENNDENLLGELVFGKVETPFLPLIRVYVGGGYCIFRNILKSDQMRLIEDNAEDIIDEIVGLLDSDILDEFKTGSLNCNNIVSKSMYKLLKEYKDAKPEEE